MLCYFGRYYESMRRRNYVTPTSYLELIKTFKNLLNKKRLELLTLKDRYVVGLEKLEFSESQVELTWNFCMQNTSISNQQTDFHTLAWLYHLQVAVMQKELQDLQPKLEQTSIETEELIVIIEKETVEVEAVKKVVEADEAVANKAAMEAKMIKVYPLKHPLIRSYDYRRVVGQYSLNLLSTHSKYRSRFETISLPINLIYCIL